MRNEKHTVFHLFSEFLPLTMIWAYRLLAYNQAKRHQVGALTYLNLEQFADGFTFWENPKYRIPGVRPGQRAGLLHGVMRKTKIFDRSLEKHLRTAGVDLLHCHFGHIGADYFHLAKKLDIPVVVSFYGYDYGRILTQKPAYRERYRRMFEAVDAVVCEGPFARGQLERLGCPGEKLAVIPLGVDPDYIPFFRREKKEDALNLLQVATFTARKGHIYTLQAIQRLTAKCPGLRLTLAGGKEDPGLREELERYVTEHGLEQVVRFMGPVSYADFKRLMADHHIFIQPSVLLDNGDCEGGAPVAMLDAQASGMPVITSDHCDNPNLVRHGQTGWVVPEKTVEPLVTAIQRFYTMDADAYGRLSRAARGWVEDRFSARPCIAHLDAVYDEVL